MSRWWALSLLLIAVQSGAETLSHGRFQNISIYRPDGEVRRVVLFLSGTHGWTPQLAHSAQSLAARGALVAGIDSRALFAELERDTAECVLPDGDLENLSHFLQAYYRLPTYQPAVLMGQGAGATLSYAMLAQAPADTFAGAVSIDFCPQLALRKPLCEAGTLHFARSRNGPRPLAPARLQAPWIALQTSATDACKTQLVRRFVNAARTSELIPLGEGGNSAHSEAAIDEAVLRLDQPLRPRAATSGELSDLPLIEVPAKRPGSMLAVLLSGDGGWAGIDKALAASLAEQGISLVGLDSLRYFWKERTPQSTAADVDRIVRHYREAWHKKEVVLIGYSQGADVLPFIINRLPKPTRALVRMAAMLSLGNRAAFAFHLASWLPRAAPAADEGLAITPELQSMTGVRALCVYSDEDGASSCPLARSETLRAVNLPGGHHFGGDYDRVAALIIEQLR
jgi:type IV secretory pathway VirJ component